MRPPTATHSGIPARPAAGRTIHRQLGRRTHLAGSMAFLQVAWRMLPKPLSSFPGPTRRWSGRRRSWSGPGRGVPDRRPPHRVMATAEPGRILTSRTVRDLVVGSDIGLHDEGTRPLKGVEGTWQLFSVARDSPPDRRAVGLLRRGGRSAAAAAAFDPSPILRRTAAHGCQMACRPSKTRSSRARSGWSPAWAGR